MSIQLMYLNPFDLEANPWNSNKVDKTNFAKLKGSLDKHGAFKAAIVRELPTGKYQILGGYHRVEAAKELGWERFPVTNLGPIDDDKAKEIGLLDNTRYGEDDRELLDKLLSELEDLDGLEAILPEEELIELPVEDLVLDELAEERDEKDAKDETHKTIKLKLEIDKAEEIEAILSRVAYDHDYTYSDGHSNFGDALYHVLILERK